MNNESEIELCDGYYEMDYSLNDKSFTMKCRGDDCFIVRDLAPRKLWMVGSNNERGRTNLTFVGIHFAGWGDVSSYYLLYTWHGPEQLTQLLIPLSFSVQVSRQT